jgi:hypothetical protein
VVQLKIDETSLKSSNSLLVLVRVVWIGIGLEESGVKNVMKQKTTVIDKAFGNASSVKT